MRIDEVKLLELHLTKHNELLLVADDKQNIYKRDLSWISKNIKNTQFKDRWKSMKINHRLPPEFTPIMDKFSDEYIKKGGEKFKTISGIQQSFTNMKPKIEWIEEDKIEFVKKDELKKGEKHCIDCSAVDCVVNRDDLQEVLVNRASL